MMAPAGPPPDAGDGTNFIKMGSAADEAAFGPPVVLLAGLSRAQAATAAEAIRGVWPGAVAPVRRSLLGLSVEAALDQCAAWGAAAAEAADDEAELADVARLPVLVFSGVPLDALRRAMRAYAAAGLPRPAFAKAVPNAMQKELRQLLDEIVGDHEAMLRGGAGAPPPPRSWPTPPGWFSRLTG